jgi:hypothetical protein
MAVLARYSTGAGLLRAVLALSGNETLKRQTHCLPTEFVAAVRRQVGEFLLSELVRWLVQSGQIDISVPAGRRRLPNGGYFASTVT